MFKLNSTWTTEAGYLAAIVENHNMGMTYNGYVRIPEGHPLYQHSYRKPCEFLRPLSAGALYNTNRMYFFMAICGWPITPAECFKVHGGITYCGDYITDGTPDGFWYGFDTNHAWDANFEEYLKAFRAAVRGEQSDFRTKSKEYVEHHCEELAKQLKRVADVMSVSQVRDNYRRVLASRRALRQKLSPSKHRKWLRTLRTSTTKFHSALDAGYAKPLGG